MRKHLRPRVPMIVLSMAVVLSAGQLHATAGRSTLTITESRVTHDNVAGSYKRYDGKIDSVMSACSTSRRAQSEAAVAIDPHNPQVILVTATDRCNHTTTAVGNGGEEGIYRSTDGGKTWSASLAPGYIGDTSAARNAISGFCSSPRHSESDSTLAFDADGTAYLGFQCGNGTGPLNELVAIYANDGSTYQRTVLVSPHPTDVGDDKPNLVVDRTNTASRGNIYLAWDRRTTGLAENLAPQVMVATSTDHARSFTDAAPLTGATGFDTSLAIGPDGVVYLSYLELLDGAGVGLQVMVARSTDHGRTFSSPTVGASLVNGYPVLTDLGCGDGPSACTPNYTGPTGFPVSTIAADQTGVHLIWNSYTPTGQDKIYVANSHDGVVWPAVGTPIDQVAVGHQFEPAITSAGGVITAVFYDSRVDKAYAPYRPVGNTADGKNSGPAVDSYVAQSRDGGVSWTEHRVSTRSWNPNWENSLYARTPWQGDYIYADSIPGKTFVVWTDSRDVVPGTDSRDKGATDGFDVYAPCTWGPGDIQETDYTSPNYHDACLSQGGLDQNIYSASLTQSSR